ncbi:MAG: hypothetical protein ACREBU_11855 [Nitrososphaera sp.]
MATNEIVPRNSTRVKMKHLQLDGDDTFPMAAPPDIFDGGELYLCTRQPNNIHEPFLFTRVKSMVADLELPPEVSAILSKMLGFTGQDIQSYLKDAIVGRLQADIDCYGVASDPERTRQLKILDSFWTIRR